MFRTFALAAASALACSAAVTAVTPSADAVTEPFGAVQIASRPAPIHADGSVDVVMWVRCKPGINAFELDTNVDQPKFGAFGQDVKVTGFVVPCDGTRQRVLVNISPYQGEFRANRVATLRVFVGLFDVETDTESSAEDSVNVKLVRG
jgi:hypothetical protein